MKSNKEEDVAKTFARGMRMMEMELRQHLHFCIFCGLPTTIVEKSGWKWRVMCPDGHVLTMHKEWFNN